MIRNILENDEIEYPLTLLLSSLHNNHEVAIDNFYKHNNEIVIHYYVYQTINTETNEITDEQTKFVCKLLFEKEV